MKHLLLTLALLGAFAAPAMAEEVITNLPGNTTIVHDTDREPQGVRIYNGDESVYYRALIGRYDDGARDYYNNNSTAMGALHTECAQDNRTDSSRRACVRRAVREHEHGIND